MEDDMTSYPPIDPTNFDLIVIGTGLPESILAAAASAAGKSVLHVDPNPFYGSHFASLPVHDFTSFLQAHSQPQISSALSQSEASGEFTLLPLTIRPLYSSVEIRANSPEVLENSRKFSLDLVGPRILFCADEMINLILKTDINQYMEFKSVGASFFYDSGDGNLSNVPDSRSAIFKDKSMSFTEKNQLMRFFKLVQAHFENESGEENKKISDEDLDSPFVDFLTQKIGLSKKLKSIILYAIALADYDQENKEVCKDVLKTKDGLDRLMLYNSSMGRFPNAPGAMIYPIYGQGELPQAFCRRAAVKGCIYVLRMPVIALLVDKDVGNYRGVRLVSGQEIFSHKLILAPSFVLPLGITYTSSYIQQDGSHGCGSQDVKKTVARGICITKSSLKSDVTNCLVFYPPQSLYPEQLTSVRVLQLSSDVAVCPSGMFVIYLSAICDNATEGKKLIDAAINSLFSISILGNTEDIYVDHQNDNTSVKLKPDLLWSAVYIQELTVGTFDCITSAPMPDGSLQYNSLLDTIIKLFQKIYPDEEFFPKTISSDDEPVDDGASEL